MTDTKPQLSAPAVSRLRGTMWQRLGKIFDRHCNADGVFTYVHDGRPVLFKFYEERVVEAGGRPVVLGCTLKTVKSVRVRDPAISFDSVAVHLLDYAPRASILTLTAKPSHNIPTGTFALNMLLELLRALRCKSVTLTDMSYIYCDTTGDAISLRRVLLLSRGKGWYEGVGFRNALQRAVPSMQTRITNRATSVKASTVIAYFRRVGADLTKDGRHRCIVFRPPRGNHAGSTAEGDSKHLRRLRINAGTIVRVLSKYPGPLTMADAVKAMSKDSCASLDAFLGAIMPASMVVLTANAKGAKLRVPKWLNAICEMYLVENFRDMELTLTPKRR